jgi:anti-sigma regulatory factor (Ser/Thr protein kinase)
VRGRGAAGQAAVEVALVLPVLALLALVLAQVGLVVRDHVQVTFGAREGAREAAVSPAADAARQAVLASTRLDPERLDVRVADRGAPGSRVRVELRYRSPTELPLVGRLLGDVTVRGEATMRVEQ